MKNNLTGILLFIATLLNGCYAGIGFFGLIGLSPALLQMSSPAFAEFWQHIDLYMGSRMPFFGPLLLLSILSAIIAHIRQWRSRAFWLLITALLMLIVDASIAITILDPLNTLVQSWHLGSLPGNVEETKMQIIDAFWLRYALMIGSFGCVLIAVFMKRQTADGRSEMRKRQTANGKWQTAGCRRAMRKRLTTNS